MKNNYVFVNEDGEEREPDIHSGLIDEQWTDNVGLWLGYNRIERGIEIAEVRNGIAYVRVELRDDTNHRTAVEFIVPVARLYEVRGNQFSYRDIGMEFKKRRQYAAQMQAAVMEYEKTGKCQTAVMEFDEPGIRHIHPLKRMPKGLKKKDFPGPVVLAATDTAGSDDRNLAVAELIAAFMREYEAEILVLDPILKTKLERLVGGFFNDLHRILDEHGLIARDISSGENEGWLMVMKTPTRTGGNFRLSYLTMGNLIADGYFKSDSGMFSAGDVEIREYRRQLSIGDYFRELVDFYREKHGGLERFSERSVVLVADKSIFRALCNCVEFGDEDDWEPFVKKFRTDMLVHSSDIHDTTDHHSTAFMVADNSFYHGDNATDIKRVRLTPELLESDGFWEDGCFSCIDYDGARQCFD